MAIPAIALLLYTSFERRDQGEQAVTQNAERLASLKALEQERLTRYVRPLAEVAYLLTLPTKAELLSSDVTGLMSAMYRVLEQGWSVEDALAELTEGGYGYHSVWTNILRYVRGADLEKLRAAIAAPARD